MDTVANCTSGLMARRQMLGAAGRWYCRASPSPPASMRWYGREDGRCSPRPAAAPRPSIQPMPPHCRRRERDDRDPCLRHAVRSQRTGQSCAVHSANCGSPRSPGVSRCTALALRGRSQLQFKPARPSRPRRCHADVATPGPWPTDGSTVTGDGYDKHQTDYGTGQLGHPGWPRDTEGGDHLDPVQHSPPHHHYSGSSSARSSGPRSSSDRSRPRSLWRNSLLRSHPGAVTSALLKRFGSRGRVGVGDGHIVAAPQRPMDPET